VRLALDFLARMHATFMRFDFNLLSTAVIAEAGGEHRFSERRLREIRRWLPLFGTADGDDFTAMCVDMTRE
jgi:hypothetical protein